MIKDDYKEANVPMLPSVSGEKTTVLQIVIYAVITAIVSLLPAANKLVGGVYVSVALVLGVLLIQRSVTLFRGWDRPRALSMYKFSMLYLALLFLAMAVDARFRL
jgi:heme o synthase